MSENGVTRLLLIIFIVTWAQKGSSLECYVCTSVNDAACTSSLSGIELSTCTLDESSNSSTTTITESDTTAFSTESTTSSDSVTTITTVTDSSTSAATSATSTTEGSSTFDSTTSYAITSTGNNSSETSTISIEGTTDTPSGNTQAPTTSQTVTSTATATTEGTTTDGTGTTSTSTSLASRNSEPLVRSVRATDVNFACYTLTLIEDGETVTDRGCVVQSESMCDTLQEENYPDQNVSTCTTCTEDGCNSSVINVSGIPSVLFPIFMFILTR